MRRRAKPSSSLLEEEVEGTFSTSVAEVGFGLRHLRICRSQNARRDGVGKKSIRMA